MARPADPTARDSLIGAARERFVQQGLQGARIEDITKACGLSKGAFYLHFKSKEALFKELLREFARKMRGLLSTRKSGISAFLQTEGVPTAADIRQQAPCYLCYIELTKKYDLAILELCWEYRDVVHVMVRGVQGTAFEGQAWKMLQRSLAHLERQEQMFIEKGTIRRGMAEGLMPAMLVGTYSMLCFQMIDMKRKPDFDAWAYGLNRLLHEGCAPCEPLARQEHEETLETPLLTSTKSCGLWAEKTKRRNS